MAETKLKQQAIRDSITFTRLSMSGSHSYTSGDEKVPFDTADFNTGGEFNTTSDKWIASKDGYIDITVQVSSSTNFSNYYQMFVYLNGSRYVNLRVFGFAHGVYQPSMRLGGLMPVSANDEIEVYFQAGSAITINGSNAGATFVSIKAYYFS